MLNFDMRRFLELEFKCRKSGNELYFCCPFCEDKSYNYWFDVEKKYTHRKTNVEYKGLGQCFKCSSHHNIVTFIMQHKSFDLFQTLSFIQGDKNISAKGIMSMIKNLDKENQFSISKLFDTYYKDIQVDFPPGSTTDLPDSLVQWFSGTGYIENEGQVIAKRAFPKELLKMLGVKYCHKADTNPSDNWKVGNHEIYYGTLKNRALLPIETNSSFAWQGYLYKPGNNRRTGETFSKTRNPPGDIMQNLLSFYNYSKESKCVLINEGYFDGLRTLSRGYNSVALNGKSLSMTQAFLMSKMEAVEFCMCLDGGEKEFLQAIKNCKTLNNLVEAEITIMRLPDGLDPDDCPEKQFKKSYNNRISFDSLKYKIDSSYKHLLYNNS
jgi:hypothetical protein